MKKGITKEDNMADFEYKIYKNVYDDIINGIKTTEFRLLNDKSNSIKQGDKIKFKVLDDESKYIVVEVLNKYIYENIDDLWEHKEALSNNILSYNKEEVINAFYKIFGKETVLNSKIVGIEFKLM